MKIEGKGKKGASMIFLVLVIVVTISIFTIVVSYLDNSYNMLQSGEEEFKSRIVAYNDELDLYMQNERKNKENKFKKDEFNVYGDELRNVIPYIKEEDMAKFEIEKGKLVYIGTDTYEKKWTEEVLEEK